MRARNSTKDAAEVLVIADEPSCVYATFQSALLEQILRATQVSLCKMGAPYDCILTDDLDLLDTKRYKLVIFLNAYHLSNAQRRLIRRKLLSRDRTILWCYAPGYFNGSVDLGFGNVFTLPATALRGTIVSVFDPVTINGVIVMKPKDLPTEVHPLAAIIPALSPEPYRPRS